MDRSNDSEVMDRFVIRELLGNWVLWRDAGDWERLATTWHADGVMISTWQQSDAATFIEACKAGWRNGVDVLHAQGPTGIRLAGDRAIAESKMAISQRVAIEGLSVDVTCFGRFYDFLERRDDRWGIVLRQPIYERDRLDCVEPCTSLTLDRKLLDGFPEGYRHLAYVQTLMGFKVKTDMPGLKGPEVERLYACGQEWLAGGTGPSGADDQRTKG